MQGITRIAIFGANGMLGRYVSSVLKDMSPVLYTRKEFDILKDSINDLPDYDLVINCAGIIKQREAHAHDMLAVNKWFPIRLNQKYKLIQISTDCVFESRGRRYENEEPDSDDIYGHSKACGEQGMVIRTSIIGEGNPLGLLDWVLSQSEIDGYMDHWWNGVTCLHLAKYIRHLILNKPYEEKIIHYHSDTVNKAWLCRNIAFVYGHDIKVNDVYAGHVDRTLIGQYCYKTIMHQLYEMADYNM